LEIEWNTFVRNETEYGIGDLEFAGKYNIMNIAESFKKDISLKIKTFVTELLNTQRRTWS